MNFALLFFITLFTGILSTNNQPNRTEIKARFNDDGDCNAAGTMNLCGNGTVWNATATATATNGLGQCVPHVTEAPYNCFIAGFCVQMRKETWPSNYNYYNDYAGDEETNECGFSVDITRNKEWGGGKKLAQLMSAAVKELADSTSFPICTIE